VPINATSDFQRMPVGWSPAVRVTSTESAAGPPNDSGYVILFFSSEDMVFAEYGDLSAGYDPAMKTASFRGPLRPQPTRFP
jgi:hypothetical protein